MHSIRKLSWAFIVFVPVFLGIGALAAPLNIPGGDERNIETLDDFVPEITDRVARVSFIRGDARVKRVGSTDWERVVLNLPAVAGDEIITDPNSRVEIQFDLYTHVRIAESSVLRLTTLKDGGIALSVPQGSVSVRVSDFDKDRRYLEIDAPQTTVAVERSGMYRVDAGQNTGDDVRVGVDRDGQARVYTDNSGFTLRSGRSVTLTISGPYAGEMQTSDLARFTDEFDGWSLERDAVIAKRIQDADYDKYYDRDIYGAEDLNDSGEWIHTRDYGYVWRPYATSVRQYSDWSPYRYGAWRWIPPYGWTWVGDEPWSWATYHYGRWVWAGGSWVWSPYGYYRYSRSWWSPALVWITIVNNNVCWYPLPYRHRSRYYNNGHHGGGAPHHGGGQNGTPQPGTSPTPSAGQPSYPLLTPDQRKRRVTTPPLQNMPPTAVVSVPASEFGRGRGSFRTPPLAVATAAIAKSQDTMVETPPIAMLPTYKELGGRVSKDIAVETPPIAVLGDLPVRVGAADRKADAPLDDELRTKRIFGDRMPLPSRDTNEPVRTRGSEESEPVRTPGINPSATRKTGAVERPPDRKVEEDEPVRQSPSYVPPPRTQKDEPVNETPTYVPPARDTPKYDPPVRQPRYEPPARVEKPRDDPPPRHDPSPRYDPPTKSEPPPKSEPPKSSPPQKSDGPVDRKSKDGRLR